MISQFILLVAVSAAANGLALYAAAPSVLRTYPFVYTAQSSSLTTPTQQQYQAQDQLGQYAYGYEEPLSSKHEVRALDGTTRGSYSYVDATGQVQTVDYTADAAGFHVAATNLPRAIHTDKTFRTPSSPAAESADIVSDSAATVAQLPVDAGDIATARQSHLAAHEEARLRQAQTGHNQRESAAVGSDVRVLQLPHPIADTADVAAAKSVHLKRVEAEKLRNELLGARSLAPRPYILPGVYSYSIPRYFYY